MVGVYAGETSLYMVALQKKELQWADVEKTSDAKQDRQSRVTNALRDMVEKAECPKEPAWMSGSGASEVVRMVEFPDMEEEEVEGAAHFEAEEMVSRDISEMDVDYHLVEETDKGHLRVLVAASPRKLNNTKVALLNEAGLHCQGITTAVAALTASFQQSEEPESQGVVILRLGEKHCNMVVLNGKEPRILRMIHNGAPGVRKNDGEKNTQEGTDQRAIQDCVARLQTSVERSVGHEARKVPGVRDYTLYLCGESSGTAGLKDGLADSLGCPVHYFDPFKGLELHCDVPDDPVKRSCFALACGSALMGEAQ